MKVLVVLSWDGYVRNYLTTDALRGIEQEHEVYYLASDKVTSEVEDKPNFLGYYHYPDKLANQHYALFNVLMWRFRNRSPSFRFRFRRLLQLELLKYRHGYVNQLARFANGYLHTKSSPLYAMLARPKYPEINHDFWHLFDPRYGKVPIPDLIIYPSSAYDPEGNDLARIGKILKVKTLFLIDNWDNLSSKTIFWASPDHLGVWGEQSKEHAVRIQGFKPGQVTPIGTPRFDDYYTKTEPSPLPFEYVLFAGQAIAFDEVSALRLIEKEIEDNPQIYKGLKVVYRPHPWRQTRFCNDKFIESEFKHIVIDPQVKDAYYKQNTRFQPDLGYYPALLKNAKFVVAPPTTMLIESLLCHKRVLLLAYDDGVHLTSPHNALANYEHFKGVEEIEGVMACPRAYQLATRFRILALQNEDFEPDLSYYLFNDGRRYRDRLADLVRRLKCDN